MLDKYLLINIYKLLIMIRADIDNEENPLLCKLILNALQYNQSNSSFIYELQKSSEPVKERINFFSLESGEYIKIPSKSVEILIRCINLILYGFQSEDNKFAYDMVDALHEFPEMLSENSKINMHQYWNIYFKPLTKKYQCKDIKELKKLFWF